MKKIIIFLVLLSMNSFFITGCGQGKQSDASILIYDNKQYIGKEIVSENEYSNLQQAGTVLRKVGSGQFPESNFSSNELAEGTEIYVIDENTLLAKLEDGKFKLFKTK